MRKLLLYSVLNEIYKRTCKFEINEDDLSNVLIDLDKSGFNITSVIENLNGLCTPYLKYQIQDLLIFNILNNSSKPLHITEEGLKYITSETKPIYENSEYEQFLKTSEKLIEKYAAK